MEHFSNEVRKNYWARIYRLEKQVEEVQEQNIALGLRAVFNWAGALIVAVVLVITSGWLFGLLALVVLPAVLNRAILKKGRVIGQELQDLQDRLHFMQDHPQKAMGRLSKFYAEEGKP